MNAHVNKAWRGIRRWFYGDELQTPLQDSTRAVVVMACVGLVVIRASSELVSLAHSGFLAPMYATAVRLEVVLWGSCMVYVTLWWGYVAIRSLRGRWARLS